MREWVRLAAGTPVLIHPAIEEGFITGMRTGYGIPYYQVKSDPMQAMTVEMLRGLAARHHAAGVDGLYLFNFPGTWTTYGYDNSPALDDIASPLRLRFKDKRYAVMRRNGSFPNCFPQERRIPAELGADPAEIGIEVADDLAAAGARVRSVHLKLLLVEPCHEDRLEVRLNGGEPLPIANPMAAGRAAPPRARVGGVRPDAGTAARRRQPDQRTGGTPPAPGEGAAAGAQRHGDRRLLPLPERPLDPAPRLQAEDVEKETMGEVKVDIRLGNFVDRVKADEGLLPASQVRTLTPRGLVLRSCGRSWSRALWMAWMIMKGKRSRRLKLALWSSMKQIEGVRDFDTQRSYLSTTWTL